MNKPYKVIPLEQSSMMWLAYRNTRVGGSDVNAIMGCDGAYKKRTELLHEKLTGETKEITDFTRALFDKGHAFEAAARTALSVRTGEYYEPMVLESIIDPRHMVSLDGINESRTKVLEVKSTKKKEFIDLAKDGKHPDLYDCQIQWQLFISGCATAILIVVNSETGEMYEIEVNRDDVKIALILSEVNKFLDEMGKGVSPFKQLETVEVRMIAGKMNSIHELEKQVKIYKKQVQEQAAQLLKEHGAIKIEGYGVRIQEIESAGSVVWKDVPEVKVLSEEYLDKFRAKSRKSVKVSEIKNKQGELENE